MPIPNPTGIIFDPVALAQSSSDCMTATNSNDIASQLADLGWDQADIDQVTATLDNYPVSTSILETELNTMPDKALEELEDPAQATIDKEVTYPQKEGGALNGRTSTAVIEPYNITNVSTPKNIPNGNNSFKEEHPDTFGYKDRAGNWEKHNLLTGLFQKGLNNGYLFRSDKAGNTTVYIPANHKVKIGQTFNINSGAFDHFIDGAAHIESNKKITIKAPDVEIIGNFQVTGPQKNSSTITAIGDITAPKVIGSVNGIFGGKSFLGHTHPGDSGGNTGVPN